MYNEKLGTFFKAKGLKQKEVGEILGFSPAMMGRYLHGTASIGPEFLTRLIKHFPEIDLNDLFVEENRNVDMVNEPRERYGISVLLDISDIEDKLQLIKEKLTQKDYGLDKSY
jgi:transcriptional regulator with XRE-family HTH domain